MNMILKRLPRERRIDKYWNFAKKPISIFNQEWTKVPTQQRIQRNIYNSFSNICIAIFFRRQRLQNNIHVYIFEAICNTKSSEDIDMAVVFDK